MPLDAPAQKTEVLDFDASGFTCSRCRSSFASEKALLMHNRTRHKEMCPMMQYLNESLRCPVCAVQFPNVPRALGHLTEPRVRGGRPISCRQVCLAGLIRPAPQAVQEKVAAAAREQRKAAKASGHATPLARLHAKRPSIGTIVLVFNPSEVYGGDRFPNGMRCSPLSGSRPKPS